MNRFALVTLCALATACGGQSGTITLDVVTSPADDPFGSAANVRITVGDGLTIQTQAVSGGHFSLSVNQKPDKNKGAAILVEALDAANNVIAYGRTPAVSLAPADQGPYGVWVGRPGRVVPAAAALPVATTEIAAVSITGLGALYAGGRDKDGNVLATTAVYDVFTQGMIQTAPMTQARTGAVGGSVAGVRGVVFGGATMGGLGSPAAPLNNVELFDPSVGTGLWAPLAGDPTDARSFASLAALASGTLLISGGADGNNQPIGTAALITTDSSPRLTAISGPMAAPRRGHAVAAATFSDGAGAVLFGGLPTGSTGPVAERLVGQAFAAYDLGSTVGNRVNATATPLADGRVLVLGGLDDAGMIHDDGIAISPSLPAMVAPIASALSVPREGHSATLLANNDILICGGAKASGMLADTCDLVDGVSGQVKESAQLGTGRRDHTATMLETGIVLIAGGTGPDGAPLASMEIYTPHQ